MNKPLPDVMIVADVETTGVSPDSKIVEVSLVEVDKDLEVVHALSSHINPGIHIPASASAIHHITDSMVADAPTETQFFSRLAGLKAKPVIFVAHNAAFDWQFLSPYFHPESVILDTLRLARHVFPAPDVVENHKLQTLRYTFNLDAGRAHSADGDTLTLVSLIKLIAQEHNLSVEEMVELAARRLAIKSLPFGKHAGVPLEDLPKDYVRWALGNMTRLDADHRAALEAVL